MCPGGRTRLLLVLIGALVGCASTPPPAQPLDEQAQAACTAFAPLGGQVRRGDLEGPPLYRALQDVYDLARTSGNEEVAHSAQRLLAAAINNDQQATASTVTELQEACGLPFR